jgi:hypothetical protein
MNTKTANTTKSTTVAELTKHDESTKANPVQFVRSFVVKHHKTLGRSGCIRALVEKHGIAYYTARTQYQKVHAMKYKLPKVEKAKVAETAKA